MSDDLSAYRPNVGVVLFNAQGQVWLGRRANTPDPWNWQFPQGGVDDGEDLEAAAKRELAEETGVVSATLLGRTDGWVVYDFPPEVLNKQIARGWKGQKQVWFAFRFDGDESEINLSSHADIEFDAWRWGALDEAVELIIPFKRDVYGQVADAFRRFAGV